MTNGEEEDGAFWIKYVVMPAWIAFHQNLTATAKILFSVINILDGTDGCYASNRYLAKLINVKEITVSRAISSLVELGIVEKGEFNGRKRILKIADRGREELDIMESALSKKIRQHYLFRLGSIIKKDNHNNNSIIIKNYNTAINGSEHGSDEPCADDTIELTIRRRKDAPLPPKPLKVPDAVKQIIGFWNNSGLRRHNNPNTKVYQQVALAIKRLMRGVFFDSINVPDSYHNRKWSQDEIIIVVKRFALAATNPDYSPVNKDRLRGMSLVDFLFNPFFETQSHFIRYFESEPDMVKNHIPELVDSNPATTTCLRDAYTKKVLGGIDTSFSRRSQNKFVLGSKLMREFFAKNRRLINPAFARTPKDQANILIDSLLDKFQDIQVGSVCSQHTFEQVLPAYMRKRGMMEGVIN